MRQIDGKTLIDWGFTPGRYFGEAIKLANAGVASGMSEEQIKAGIRSMEPLQIPEIPYRSNAIPFEVFLDAETPEEVENKNAVMRDVDSLVRTPTVERAAVMPDACPAGVIPVGGVVAASALHPGFHSADVCCSMAITVLKRDEDVGKIMDVAEKVTHFGPGKRAVSQTRQNRELRDLLSTFSENPFLRQLEGVAEQHFTTQGDGNHFLFVGRRESDGLLAIVTHHGSRGLGAQLYKRGMQSAEKHTRIASPRTPRQASWIQPDSLDEENYWDALQKVRLWTKMNHFAIHDEIAKRIGNKVVDRFWNEHNFVFRKSDGLFYHAKGATPNYAGFSADDDGRTLIPMNMGEPILVVGHANKPESMGFAPHGAGRNMSRTKYLLGEGSRDVREILEQYAPGVDVRFWCGIPDPSELPPAYKRAHHVVGQIEKYGLARIEDRIHPLGSIMAGDWEKDAPWRKKR